MREGSWAGRVLGDFLEGEDGAAHEFDAAADDFAFLGDVDPGAAAGGADAGGAGDGDAVDVGALPFVAAVDVEVKPDERLAGAGTAEEDALGFAEGELDHVGREAEFDLAAADAGLGGDGKGIEEFPVLVDALGGGGGTSAEECGEGCEGEGEAEKFHGSAFCSGGAWSSSSGSRTPMWRVMWFWLFSRR